VFYFFPFQGAINFDRNIKSFVVDNKTSADELSMILLRLASDDNNTFTLKKTCEMWKKFWAYNFNL